KRSLCTSEPPRTATFETRQWSVIAGEDDECVFGNSQFFQPIEQPTHLFIKFGKYQFERGFFIRIHGKSSCLTSVFFRHPRRMHIVRPQVHEAGCLFVPAQEIERLVDKVSRPIPPQHAILVRPYPVRGG